jgi:hypothetical protein
MAGAILVLSPTQPLEARGVAEFAVLYNAALTGLSPVFIILLLA